MSKRARWWAGILLVAASSVLSGQSVERHLANSATGEICRQSAYLHGYIHGYEEGFRIGDLEVHLGRPKSQLSSVQQPRPARKYDPALGSNKYFRLGIRDGFAIAYEDARQGLAFRGLWQLQRAGEELRGFRAGGQELDEGLAGGYADGKKAPDPMTDAKATERASRRCRADASHSPAYCAAFVWGFRLARRDHPSQNLAAGGQLASGPHLQN